LATLKGKKAEEIYVKIIEGNATGDVPLYDSRSLKLTSIISTVKGMA
jgi:hypothetical protein